MVYSRPILFQHMEIVCIMFCVTQNAFVIFTKICWVIDTTNCKYLRARLKWYNKLNIHKKDTTYHIYFWVLFYLWLLTIAAKKVQIRSPQPTCMEILNVISASMKLSSQRSAPTRKSKDYLLLRHLHGQFRITLSSFSTQILDKYRIYSNSSAAYNESQLRMEY